MAIEKLKPLSPDPRLDADRYGGSTIARFAHINWLIEQINSQPVVDPRPYKVYTALLS